MMIYGDPGVGKTVLAGSAAAVESMRPVLFIDIEGGTMSIKDKYPADVVRIESWAEMQKVYDELYAMKHGYKTVVLDSLTEIQKFSMYNIMHDLMKTDPSRDPDVPGMREWGKNIEQIRRLCRAFRDLPVNTIMTALAKSDKDARSGIVKTTPSLSGKLANEVAGFLDIVVYMYTKFVRKEESQVLERLLLTAPTDSQTAKDRTSRLPTPVIEQPTMKLITDCLFGNGLPEQE